MSILISNKTKSLIPKLLEVTDDSFLTDLLTAGDVVSSGTVVYVNTATENYVEIGIGEPFGDNPQIVASAPIVPAAPVTGDYVLESEDGEVKWVLKSS